MEREVVEELHLVWFMALSAWAGGRDARADDAM